MSLNLDVGGQGILLGPSGVGIQGARAGWFPTLLSNPSFKSVS